MRVHMYIILSIMYIYIHMCLCVCVGYATNACINCWLSQDTSSNFGPRMWKFPQEKRHSASVSALEETRPT